MSSTNSPPGAETWVLTVTLGSEDYEEAAERTGVLQRWQPGWGEFVVEARPTQRTITLTGDRFLLLQVLDFYPKTWPSAQIEFRPASAILAEEG